MKFRLNTDMEPDFSSFFDTDWSDHDISPIPGMIFTEESNKRKVRVSGQVEEKLERFFVLETNPGTGGGMHAPARERISVVDTDMLRKEYNFEIIFLGKGVNWTLGFHGENTLNREYNIQKKNSTLDISGDREIRPGGKIRSGLVSPLAGDGEKKLEFYTQVEIDF